MASFDMKKYQKEYYQKNKARCDARTKENRKNASPETIKIIEKRNKLKRNYGISLEEWVERVQSQDGKCKICGCEFDMENTRKAKGPAVDHCHDSGKIRGILCNNCNRGIGFFKDDTIALGNAISYLMENKD